MVTQTSGLSGSSARASSSTRPASANSPSAIPVFSRAKQTDNRRIIRPRPSFRPGVPSAALRAAHQRKGHGQHSDQLPRSEGHTA